MQLIDASCILWVQPSLKLHVSGFPFSPPWRVQPQPPCARARAHSANTWVLPVNAGSVVNGKWYMTGRLRTKSFSSWHTLSHTFHPPLPSARGTLTPSRISWVHFSLWQCAQGLIYFVTQRIQMAQNITQIKRLANKEDFFFSLVTGVLLWKTIPWFLTLNLGGHFRLEVINSKNFLTSL